MGSRINKNTTGSSTKKIYRAEKPKKLKKHTGKRSFLEIQIDILKTITNGEQSITRIMTASNTNLVSLRGITNDFLDKELITREYNKTRYYYFITEKGEEAIRKYRELMEII